MNDSAGKKQKDGKIKKKRTSAGRIVKIVLLSALAVVLCVVIRYIYVMFVDPMSAFTDSPPVPTAQTPFETEALSETETPVATQPPVPETPVPETPLPAASAELPAATVRPDVIKTLKPKLTPTPKPTPIPLDTNFMKNRVNVLLLGWDQSPEREVVGSDVYRGNENNYRSDVMMLLSADFKKNIVDIISIPRDTFSTVFNEKGEMISPNAHWKINAAFAKGQTAGKLGPQYAMATVSKLLGGIPIQYYAGVDMEGLKAVVNAMGGVDYDVDVRIELNGRVLEKGYQHLDGQQVLDYCRARKGISSDVGRNDRQQRMLMAIFYQVKSRDQLANIPNIYLSVKDYVNTNLNLEQIAALAALGARMDNKNLRRHTLKGTYVDNTSYGNASYYVIHNDALIELIAKVFEVTITPMPRWDIGYVLAEKAAKEARTYAAGAAYLLNMPSISAAFEAGEMRTMELKQRLDKAIIASQTATERGPFDDLDLPLDIEAIAAATAELRAAMYELCKLFEVTQKDVQKSGLPSDFYKLLPKK